MRQVNNERENNPVTLVLEKTLVPLLVLSYMCFSLSLSSLYLSLYKTLLITSLHTPTKRLINCLSLLITFERERERDEEIRGNVIAGDGGGADVSGVGGDAAGSLVKEVHCRRQPRMD